MRRLLGRLLEGSPGRVLGRLVGRLRPPFRSLPLTLVLALAACGAEGPRGNAVFSIGKGWERDSTVPIARLSVFSASARETGPLGAALLLAPDNTAVIALSAGGAADEFEAVGVGTCALVARTEAGTELDRMTFEVAAPAKVEAAYWTDLSLDPAARLGNSIAAVSLSTIELKLIVTDAAGRRLRHLGVARLASAAGAPVRVDPDAPTTLRVGAAGSGGFEARVATSGGPVRSQYGLEVVGDVEQSVKQLDIAAGPVEVTAEGEGTPVGSGSGSTGRMHLVFARCSDGHGLRIFGCKPTWSLLQGSEPLWLGADQKSDYNWVSLDVGEAVTVKATLGGLIVSRKVEYDVTSK